MPARCQAGRSAVIVPRRRALCSTAIFRSPALPARPSWLSDHEAVPNGQGLCSKRALSEVCVRKSGNPTFSRPLPTVADRPNVKNRAARVTRRRGTRSVAAGATLSGRSCSNRRNRAAGVKRLVPRLVVPGSARNSRRPAGSGGMKKEDALKIAFYGRDTEAFADGFPGLLSAPAEIAVLPDVPGRYDRP